MSTSDFASTFLLFLLAMATGCGGDNLGRVSVEGSVSVDGAPLADGSLSLIPAAGTTGPSAGATIENGAYFIDADKGPVPGTYRVEIKAMRKTGRKIVDEHQPPPNNLLDEMEQFIPPQYNANSTLSVEVKAGKNRDVDFALNTKD
jgi:hypothetical protein